LKRQITELKKTVQEKTERSRTVERENESLKKKYSQLVASLDKDKDKSDYNQQDLEDERLDILNELKEYEEKNRNLEKDLSNRNEQIMQLQKRIQT
jgi:chromosome segregation ATPase